MDRVAEVALPLLCVSVWWVRAKGVPEGLAELLGHLRGPRAVGVDARRSWGLEPV